MGRRYDNSGRRVEAARTRRRILDAAIELIGRPGGALVLAEVAEIAGVALATVYKHFGTRAALLRAVRDRVDQTAARPPVSRSISELRASVPALHAFFKAREGVVRAVVRNPDLSPLRSAAFRARDAGLDRLLADAAAHLSRDERLALRALLVRVMAAPAWLELKDEYQLADDVVTRMTGWAVAALLDRLADGARRARAATIRER
ncbi:MAG TPA: helix-turn-helix domain-containing protein [Vicinamibacterales bacterium]|nr:helix-turn-helix domain-containing protein [Vicinamibacterales bacterium]